MIEIGASGPETPAISQIAAQVEERRRLLGVGPYRRDAAWRLDRLREIDTELEPLWCQRRVEISRAAERDGALNREEPASVGQRDRGED